MFDVITKEEAKVINQNWYFTGMACKNGHFDKRYVNTGICCTCKREINQRSNKANPDSLKARYKRYYSQKITTKGKAYLNQKSIEWVNKNKERRKEIRRKSKLKNAAKIKDYQKRKRESPSYRIGRSVSKAIWKFLKHRKAHRHWEDLVSFSSDDLLIHLESKFKDGMTWENYGSYWHIDHIRPLSWFNLETQFNEAWALSNLQPLEKELNLSKGNRYEG